jgi:hypothetical protein
MKELRHIRRSRERWLARRDRRAAWWAGQGDPWAEGSYAMRAWVDWARHAVEPEVELSLQSYVRRMNRDYWRKTLGLA